MTAGLVMLNAQRQALLVHPGGPFFRNRDVGVWGIPKGQVHAGEDIFAAAMREFEEEVGFTPTGTTFHALGSIKQGGGKRVQAWSFVGVWDPSELSSQLVRVEWPKHSGQLLEVPEVDRAAFFCAADARSKIVPAQWPLLTRAFEIFDQRR